MLEEKVSLRSQNYISKSLTTSKLHKLHKRVVLIPTIKPHIRG
jgi:hypothetical protein